MAQPLPCQLGSRSTAKTIAEQLTITSRLEPLKLRRRGACAAAAEWQKAGGQPLANVARCFDSILRSRKKPLNSQQPVLHLAVFTEQRSQTFATTLYVSCVSMVTSLGSATTVGSVATYCCDGLTEEMCQGAERPKDCRADPTHVSMKCFAEVLCLSVSAS